MNPTIHNLLSTVELGRAQQYHDLTVVPLVGPPGGGMEYVALGDALEKGALVITEVSEGGSVPELAVVNSSELVVLLVDGEELMGAKQNRVLNATMLVPPRARMVLPVSCTEVGRWRRVSPTLAESGLVAAPSVRQVKSASVHRALETMGVYRADQGAVWDGIARLHHQTGVESPTSAMRDAFVAHKAAIQECVAAMPLQEGQTGLLALRGGRVVGVDWVSRPEVYARLHPKLVKSYAIEGVGEAGSTEEAPDAAPAQAFLSALLEAAGSERPSVGLGTDWRLSGAGVLGSALVCDGEVVHMAAFPVEVEG